MPSSASARKETVMSSAMSTSPPRRRLNAGPGSAGSRVSSTAGWRSRKGAIGPGLVDAAALGDAAEGAVALGHDGRAGAGERGQPQAPAAQAGDRLELGLGVGQAGEDRVGVLYQRAARIGQAHAARVALDERRARLALEGGDLL